MVTQSDYDNYLKDMIIREKTKPSTDFLAYKKREHILRRVNADLRGILLMVH